MELSVYERLLLLGALPREGNIVTVKVVHNVRQDVALSDAEITELGLTQEPGGNITWKREKEKPKEIEFGSKAMTIIAEALKDLDKQKKLTDAHISLWEKFCPEET